MKNPLYLKFKYFIFLFCVLLSIYLSPSNSLSSFDLTSGTFYQTSFEEGISGMINDGWVFANQNHWQVVNNSINPINGKYVLEEVANNGSSGLRFDTIQYRGFSFENGFIEGWIFSSGSNSKEPGVYLRTGYQSNVTTCDELNESSICSGYRLGFYDNYVVFDKLNQSGHFNLDLWSFSQYYSGNWWHVKLQAIGNQLTAWIAKNGILPAEPQINVSDSTYNSGYAAINGRSRFTAGPYNEFFDYVTITNFALNQVVETTSTTRTFSTTETICKNTSLTTILTKIGASSGFLLESFFVSFLVLTIIVKTHHKH